MIEIVKTPSVDLNIDEFTHNVETDIVSGTVTGDGIFDTLMETATKHLLAQFESNRIRQEDYANAYIHIYEVTLQAALKAWLEKDLVAAQIRQTEAGTAKIEAETAKTIAEMEMIQPQIAKIEAETDKIKAETELLPLQKDILLVEKDKIEAETAKIEAETTLLPEQLELLGAQVNNEKEKLKLITKQLELLGAQILAEQGKAALYRRQIEGFDESYKEKILKILLDAWGIGFSVGSDAFTAENIPAPMKEAAISKVFNEYVMRDIDSYAYSRINDTIKEVVPDTGALKDPVI